MSGEQLESFEGERYESILTQGATQNLQANQDGRLKEYPTDVSKNLL